MPLLTDATERAVCVPASVEAAAGARRGHCTAASSICACRLGSGPCVEAERDELVEARVLCCFGMLLRSRMRGVLSAERRVSGVSLLVRVMISRLVERCLVRTGGVMRGLVWARVWMMGHLRRT